MHRFSCEPVLADVEGQPAWAVRRSVTVSSDDSCAVRSQVRLGGWRLKVQDQWSSHTSRWLGLPFWLSIRAGGCVVVGQRGTTLVKVTLKRVLHYVYMCGEHMRGI